MGYRGQASTRMEHDNSGLEAAALETAATLVPLKSLKKNFLEDLFTHVVVHTVFAGDVIFDSGTYDNQHIYLQYGEIELQYLNGMTELIVASDMQHPLANVQPRPCRAMAITDCTLLRIDSDQLDRTLSWSQISQYLLSELALERDLDEDIEWMQTVLNSNLFLKVPPVNAEQIFTRLTPMVVHANEVVVRQGEIGDCCYFIKEGDAVVTRHSDTIKHSEILADIAVGRCFGEDALVYEKVRNADVTMKSDGVLMRLEKSDFLLLLKEAVVDEVSESELSSLAEKPTLIDVRTDEEYSAGHLAFSGNIPLNLLSMKKRLLSPEKLYIFYCDTGRRSRAAAYLLGKQGYNVMALRDGYVGSRMAELLVREDGYLIKDGDLVSGQ
ncbi:rhodanese-related sulfurtransferase [Alteromonadaceae bacterium 2753L.S.0a.02]|nr:rhodanese-related sulfurtransferase [Alteromonadaceae bacterium 2753L.S.0a.02]